MAHSRQQPCPGENTHSHPCCQLHLISPSLPFHVLITSCPLPMHTIPSCLSTFIMQDLTLPHSDPTIHHSSPSCSLLPRSLPTHKHKIPPRCSHINLKFLLPKPPTLLARCFSSSPNPPRLLYPLLPTFQTFLIFSAFLPLKHLLDIRSLRTTIPGSPRRRISTSSCLLLQCPGLQG